MPMPSVSAKPREGPFISLLCFPPRSPNSMLVIPCQPWKSHLHMNDRVRLVMLTILAASGEICCDASLVSHREWRLGVSSQAEDIRRDNERPRRMKKGTFSWASFGFFSSSRLVNDRLRFLAV